jgi:hypothetical protein
MHERADNRTTLAVSLAPGLDRRHAPHRVRRLLIIALPALLCASLLLFVGHDAAGPFLRSGSISYALIAENVTGTGLYSIYGENPTAARPPLYPLFLAVAIALGGSDWAIAALVGQGLIAAACLALTARIAHRLLANPWLTALSVVLVAANVSMLSIFFVLSETGLFVLLTLLYVLLVLIPIQPTARAALLGVVTALALLTRPSGVVFLPVSALVLAYLIDFSLPRLLRTLAVYFVAFGVCIAPWQIYLHQSFGRLSLIGTSTSGMNLFKGNHPLMGEIYKLTDVDKADPLIIDLVGKAGLSWRQEEWRANDHLLRLVQENIAEDPMRFVRRTAEKAIAFLSPSNVPIGRHGEVYLKDGGLVVREAEVVVGGARTLYFLFVIPLGLLGVTGALLVPGRRLWGLCVGALVAGTVLLYALTFPEKRFRIPLEPLLVIAAVDFVHRSFALRLAQGSWGLRARQQNESSESPQADG